MQAKAYSVAFEGLEARLIEVQCAIQNGASGLTLVGLGDKAISEAKERVRASLHALSIALPNRRITLNLAPAALPKEGSHFDLPIALALLAATGLLPSDEVARTLAIGELSLDGRLGTVSGALPAALTAAEHDLQFMCPATCAAEAALIGATATYGAGSLAEILRHFTGQAPLRVAKTVTPAQLTPATATDNLGVSHLDMRDIHGQETAKRALEIAAAGRHHMLMIGTPGAGKSMLAARLPSILPPLSPTEALEYAMIASIAGLSQQGRIPQTRPFRSPHHSASMAAMTGGGRHAKPGEISLAHHGVLFLDELPEFQRSVLESLRQPLETGEITIARAEAHLRYPCQLQLIAAANPCRCGWLPDAARACPRVPLCGKDYMAKISGPLLDRFDLRLDVPPLAWQELDQGPRGEASHVIAARVVKARATQNERQGDKTRPTGFCNADLSGEALTRFATPNKQGRALLARAAEYLKLSARGYHRILRVARTIADLEGCDEVNADHVGEAASYRMSLERGT